jgi:hypothetical protein
MLVWEDASSMLLALAQGDLDATTARGSNRVLQSHGEGGRHPGRRGRAWSTRR